MENVCVDLHLDNEAHFNNPKNRGWIELFKRWVRQDIFRSTWEKASQTYNPVFKKFYVGLQATGGGKDSPYPCQPEPE